MEISGNYPYSLSVCGQGGHCNLHGIFVSAESIYFMVGSVTGKRLIENWIKRVKLSFVIDCVIYFIDVIKFLFFL